MKYFKLLLCVGIFFALGCELYDSEELFNEDGQAQGVADGETGSSEGTAADEISLSGVVWLDTDVSGWAQTATLSAGVSGGTIRLDYDKARVWPHASTRASNGGPLVGNCWVFVNLDGTWYAATWDWMRPGQTSKAKSAVRGSGGHIPHAPLNTWSPRSGETYGFMVSTVARTGDRTINERSNVSMVTWP